MTAVVQKTVLTDCLAPVDKNGLEQLLCRELGRKNVDAQDKPGHDEARGD